MKKETLHAPTIDFRFQKIKLDEARTIVPFRSSRYAALVESLLANLPRSNSPYTIAFGSPNGDVLDEKEIKSLCHSVTQGLHKSGKPFHVSYSKVRKLFVVLPRTSKNGGHHVSSPTHLSNGNTNPIKERLRQGQKN